MQPVKHLLSAALLGLFSAAAIAAPTVYTSSATFLAQVAAGAYTENFDGLALPAPGPVAFSGGSFSYSMMAPNDIYASGDFVGASDRGESLTINFTGSTVKAIGGNFFASDAFDNFAAAEMTLTLSDGSSITFTPADFADSYRGFISDVAITSLVISNADEFAGLDNLTVGDAVGRVPEPASLALVGMGLAGALVSRRRQA